VDPKNSKKQQTQRLRNGILAAVVLVAAPLVRAEATTLASFEWVNTRGSTGFGELDIVLPGTVTTPQFDIPNASAADITGFEYIFSGGQNFDHTALLTSTFNPTPGAWTTTTITSATVGGSAIGDTDLTTGFVFGGLNSLSIAESQGSLSNVPVNTNSVNLGGVLTDFGYWKLASLTPSPVPLPGALPLLLSALGMFGLARRRSKEPSATG
jgi:hypothetical protein